MGYYLGFVFQKGMKDRLSRLEKAVSYLESFLDVLKRLEVLEKDEITEYERYLEWDVWYILNHRDQENHKKPNAAVIREEKIRRLRVEKETNRRLEEIKFLEEKKEKGGIVDEDLEREKWILALQSCSRKALNDLRMIPQEMEILQYMKTMQDAGKDLHREVVYLFEL